MKTFLARLRVLLPLLAVFLPLALCAQSTCIMGSSENSRLANDAELSGYYVSSVEDIPEGSNVILLGNIFTAPDHAPLYDLEKLGCKVIRLSGDTQTALSASIKAYNDYTQSGNNVFANIPKGLGNVNHPVIFTILESLELKQPGKSNTDTNFVSKPLFNTIPADEADYIPPALAKLAATGRIALDISFEPYSAILKADARGQLNSLSMVLKANPKFRIVVEGHTADDSAVDAAYHMQLSKDRANAVKKWLTDAGVDGSRIKAIGYGHSRPIADNSTKAGQAKNRRIEIVKD